MGAYRRILLKLSGEALMGDQPFGISHEASSHVASRICALQKEGYQVGVVVGGGNLYRGIQRGPELGIERTPADQMGMLSTLINGVALKSALTDAGCTVRMISALDCPKIAESYQWDRVMEYLNEGIIVLFVGGTGHPYFTTDTNAALRACEMKADILLKATTRVDGVFDKDPRQHPDATPYSTITFHEVLEKQLGIMDLSAVTMCMQAKIPIRVFNFYKASLTDALTDQPIGTLIQEK
ncbi:MAG: Uridylate kinase [Chlamydiales bacterium]|nr:Uridylate kinase [Chlamydiales bacterium]